MNKRSSRRLLGAALFGLGLLGAAGAGAQETTQGEDTGEELEQQVDRLERLINQLEGRAQGDDCWVTVYDDEGLGRQGFPGRGYHGAPGDRVRIPGPAVISRLDDQEIVSALGRDWSNDIGSLEVGPGASACFYREENFLGQWLCLGSGQVASELDNLPRPDDARVDLEDEIESLVIRCERRGL